MAVDNNAATGPQISNQMTDDQLCKLTFQHKDTYVVLLAKKKEADAAFRNHTKIMKSELGSEGLQNVKDMIEASSADGVQRIKDDIARRATVLRWLAVPINTQAELFPAEDRRPLVERAAALGKKAGLAGDPYQNPYHQTNEGHAAFVSGYQAGQSVLMKGIGKLEPDGAIDSLAGAVPAGKA